MSKKNISKIIEEFEEIKKKFTDDEMEDLVGLLGIYVKHLRPPTENWKRLIEVLNETKGYSGHTDVFGNPDTLLHRNGI